MISSPIQQLTRITQTPGQCGGRHCIRGMRDAKGIEIFEAAKQPNLVILTKDSDFVDLVCRLGSPPQILWLTCGNVTNRNLRQLLTSTFSAAISQLQQGEMVVEISE